MNLHCNYTVFPVINIFVTSRHYIAVRAGLFVSVPGPCSATPQLVGEVDDVCEY